HTSRPTLPCSPDARFRPRPMRSSLLAVVVVSEHRCDHCCQLAGCGEVEELVGTVSIRAWPEDPGDHELGLGEPVAEHSHEADRAAFAHGPRLLTERGE